MAATGLGSARHEVQASAPAILARCRSLAEPALRQAVDGMPASMRHIAGYHLGWWDEHGAALDGPGGKGIRPALTLLAARAVGGEADRAVPAAVAVELVHNFSLLHDDVMDGDRTRRHRATAWAVFGVADAILAGDAMLALAARMVAVTRHGPIAVGRLMMTVLELCDGQSADLAFERRDDVSLSDVFRMTAAKTGSLFGCACALGALSGGADPARTELLRQYGCHLGIAFQLADDLLGIWGDPAATGKAAGGDLARRKKSLPVVAALSSETAAGRELSRRYGDTSVAPEHLAALIHAAGGRTWALRQAADELAKATEMLHQAGCVPSVVDDLRAVAELMTRRDR